MNLTGENSGLPPGLQLGAGSAPMPPATVRPLPSNNPDQVFFHFDLGRALQLHRKLAISISVLASLAAGAYAAKMWNNYVAESQVYVQPAPPRLMDAGSNSRWPTDSNSYESYIQQQVHDVTRPDVLLGALHKLPPGSWRAAGEAEQAAAERLGRAVEVARIGTSYQVSITAHASSPEQAAQISNALAVSFIESATRELRAGDRQRMQLLQEERDRISKELDADRAEQEELNKTLGVAAIGAATPDPYDAQINAIRAELVKARSDSDQASARLTSLASGGSSSAALDAEAEQVVANDPGLVSLKTSLNQRRSLLISQMANLTPNNPQYKQDEAELGQINGALDSMTKELRAKATGQLHQRLRSDLERTSSVEAKLNAQLAQLTAAAGTAAPRLQRSNDLATDIQRLQSRYTTVDEQYRNMALENNAPGAVYLSTAAVPPLRASRGRVLRNSVAMVLGGIVFGLVGALLAHNLDPRIYVAADLERVLGVAPMAQLPDFYEVGTGVSEEYMLRLAAAVEHAYQQGGIKSFIFTGTAPGAGATTVANRVRSMLEAMGRESVFVDASRSVPAPAPNTPSTGSEIVALQRGSRSTALLQQITEDTAKDTIVVSDTAPLMVSGETEYMARFVDAAIVVVESGVTTKAQLREVASTLNRLQVSAVGFVLNRVSLEDANHSFRRSIHGVQQRLEAQVRALARHDALSDRGPVSEDAAEETAPELAPRETGALESAAVENPEPAGNEARQPVPAAAKRTIAPMPEAQAARPSRDVAPPPGNLKTAAEAVPSGNGTAVAADRPAIAEEDQVPLAPRPLPGRDWGKSTEPDLVASATTPQSRERFSAAAPKPAPSYARTPQVAGATTPSSPFAGQKPEDVWRNNPDAAAVDAASRLGGLRALLESLGLQQDILREPENKPPAPEREQRRERVAEAPLPEPQQVSSARSGSVPPLNTRPEILPPRPDQARETDARRAASARLARWSEADDFVTLPARNGQYNDKS